VLFAAEVTRDRMSKEAAHLDGLIDALLEKSGKTMPAPVDDFTFLRRASLVATGRIPTLDEIKEFTNDSAEDKRSPSCRSSLSIEGLPEPHEQLVL
jgi:hypothetical protein